MDPQQLAEHVTDGQARVERRVRVLEHHLYRPPVGCGPRRPRARDHRSARPPRSGRSGPAMHFAIVVLPHPDSPTRPRTSPSATWSVTSSTARSGCPCSERNAHREGVDLDEQRQPRLAGQLCRGPRARPSAGTPPRDRARQARRRTSVGGAVGRREPAAGMEPATARQPAAGPAASPGSRRGSCSGASTSGAAASRPSGVGVPRRGRGRRRWDRSRRAVRCT